MTNAPFQFRGMTCQTVTMHDLAEGDQIWHYGVRLVLSNRKDHGMRPDDNPETQGSCITFKVSLVGDYPAEGASMPRNWIVNNIPDTDRYTLQGNKLATVCKIIEG